MANRFPLVVDTDDGNKLKELPAGDNLNLDGAGIANLQTLGVASLSTDTLTTAGNATLGGDLGVNGTITVTNLVVNGDTVGAQVQSDWNETDTDSLAFILNKPNLDDLEINSLNDVADVQYQGIPQNDQILTWFNGTWVNTTLDAGRTDQEIRDAVFQPISGIGVLDNPPSGRGFIDFGKDPNNALEYGKIIYTPPAALISGDNISELNNDELYVNEAFLTTIDGAGAKYVKSNDVLGFGRLVATLVNGQVQLTFDETGLLTVESDTLQTVTDRGASTTNALEADAFNQAPTSTSTNTLKDVSVENLDVLLSITGTNATFTTTNGNINATNGSVNANNVNVSQTLDVQFITGPTNISNTTGDMELTTPAGSRVDITSGRLRIGATTMPPASPELGEIVFDGSTFYAQVNDIGNGSPGAVAFPAYYSILPLQVPTFTNSDLSALTQNLPGMIVFNVDNTRLEVYNGSNWVAV